MKTKTTERVIVKTANILEKSDFIAWLKDMHCFNEYVINVSKVYSVWIDAAIDTCWRVNEDPQSLIISAFEWKLTPEGLDKWRSIDQEWHTYLNKHNIEGKE